jgi:hypothetical protein
MSTRTTIQIDESVAQQLRARVPARGQSRFINQAIAEKLAAIERAEREAAMVEGYKSRHAERDDVERDWDLLEVEGWPE